MAVRPNLVLYIALVTALFAYALESRALSGDEYQLAPRFQPRIPKGIPVDLWQKLIPLDNPLTAEKVALGEMLFSDKRLSIDGTISCATCHDPATAFAERNTLAIGVGGKIGGRNAPTVLNAMFSEFQFWDGRASSLEDQVKHPLIGGTEMGMENDSAVVARLTAVQVYGSAFRSVFGDKGITIETIAKAIAAFERTRLSGNSPFDRFIAGDQSSIAESQKRGWELFQGKAQCITCHAFNNASPFFSDFKFHNTGIAAKKLHLDRLMLRFEGAVEAHTLNGSTQQLEFAELGRFLVTRDRKDTATFKTPTLRDVELTGPYMHDGSEKTLLDVVRFYDRGGVSNGYVDPSIRPLHLSDQEMSDLVGFLKSLTSDDTLKDAQSSRPQTRTSVFLRKR